MGFLQEEAGQREQTKTVGISERRDVDLLRNLQPQDLIRYGFIPEFIGRLPVVATLEDLDKAALVQILSEAAERDYRKQYQRLFEYENVRLRFSEDALDAIAALALERKGWRPQMGCRMIIEDMMLDLDVFPAFVQEG